MSVLIVTSVGDIVVDLHTDRCPLTSKNFLKLCKMKYYNGCLFNKVEKDFIAKTGDRTGTGTGGESVYKLLYGDQARFFADEIHPDLKHSKIGTVAMASAGENCNASQFYFTLRDDLDYLDGKHTVFGIVEEKEGLDTLAKINESYVDGEGRPFKDIRIKHTYILDDPFEDPPQLAELIPENSPEGKPQDETAEERLEDNWVPMDETLGAEEFEERIHMKAAHTNAAILESVGDIPDAEIKPPENVLFVCKLNPVTQDEDLFTIFSRFGNVTSADIIRDYKTGDSLCYAFIEFEDKEACERAYFKMDNTLIDDRRIHVDFSQSVAKLWGQYRHGKGNPSSKGGCFKCGAPDHIARDCGQASGNNQKGPKYVLKNDDTQRGGDNRKRYEMLFDENEGSGDHEGDRRTNKQKEGHQKIDDPAHRDNFKGSERRHYDSDRSRHSRGDERKHDSRRHDRHHEDKETEERKHDRRHDRRHSDNETDERLDREHRRRLESSRHRGDDGDHRRSGSNRNGKEDYRNRSPESDRHRRDDGYYERKSRDRDDETYRERRHRDDRWK